MELDKGIKEYEAVSSSKLMQRTPVIIRIDGNAFHTFTRGMKCPFDEVLLTAMNETMKELCKQISGTVMAYTQSDEISLVLIDYKNQNTEPWFKNKVQKMVSLSASIATLNFNRLFIKQVELWESENIIGNNNISEEDEKLLKTYDIKKGKAIFDSRVFTIPKEEVCNYFIWRQQDATRNSIQRVGQNFFSHSELQNKKENQIQDMLHEKNINWNDYPIPYKRGVACIKNPEGRGWSLDKEIPIFTKDRNYVDKNIFLEATK